MNFIAYNCCIVVNLAIEGYGGGKRNNYFCSYLTNTPT